jgi:hypothetical protein
VSAVILSQAPAVVIRVPLEGRPHAYLEGLHEGDIARLALWLDAHPELWELVHRAIELARGE